MSKYAKVIILSLVLGAIITAGTYAVASKKDIPPEPINPLLELGPMSEQSQQEVSRGFPWAYYQSTTTKEITYENRREISTTTHETDVDYRLLVMEFLIWTLACFPIVFLVTRQGRKHA